MNAPLLDLWDVVVVGAGPSGSVAAHALARRGLNVVVVDRAAFPRWKVCGCCLNPFTLGVLAKAGLGEAVRQCNATPVGGLCLAAGRRHANVALPGWHVLSREKLDAALLAAAVRAGAHFLPRTTAALGLESADGRTVIFHGEDGKYEVTARVVIAADGLGGRLLSGLDGCEPRSASASRVGAGVVAGDGPEFYRRSVIHMVYGHGGYVGLVRLEDGRLNVAGAFDVGVLKTAHNPGVVAERILRDMRWPAISGLSDLPWRGTQALTCHPARPAAARVLAVGDAAGYVEPFTGEGIGWAVAAGVAVAPVAARAVRQWRTTLADQWTAIQVRTQTRRRRLCRATAWLSRRPSLAGALIGIVGRFPWLAGPMVSQIGRDSGY